MSRELAEQLRIGALLAGRGEGLTFEMRFEPRAALQLATMLENYESAQASRFAAWRAAVAAEERAREAERFYREFRRAFAWAGFMAWPAFDLATSVIGDLVFVATGLSPVEAGHALGAATRALGGW